jgi:hypothetical protein
LPIRPPTPTGAPHKQVRGDPAQARRPRRHDPLRGAITPVRCGLRGHARTPARPPRTAGRRAIIYRASRGWSARLWVQHASRCPYVYASASSG